MYIDIYIHYVYKNIYIHTYTYIMYISMFMCRLDRYTEQGCKLGTSAGLLMEVLA